MTKLFALFVLAGLTFTGCAQKTAEPPSKPEAPKDEVPVQAPEQPTEPALPHAPAEPAATEPATAETPTEQEPARIPEAQEGSTADPKDPVSAVQLPFRHLPIDEIRTRYERFAPVHIRWNKEQLTLEETEMVKVLIEAAWIMDELFVLQNSPDSKDWLEKLATLSSESPDADLLLQYARIHYGPYDRLNNMDPFLGEKSRPLGGNYYPGDMTKEEMEQWMVDHPDQADAFRSSFTVIRRKGRDLMAIPYHVAYNEQLLRAHDLLKKAAGMTDNTTLKTYLSSRADAFLTSDYFQSDIDWVDLDSKVEVTIGPYEVYEDKLFGYKAAFEAFITVKDPVESEKLKTYEAWLDKMEHHLPIPDEHKNFKRGKSSPMFVVDVIFTAGDTRAGVQTMAFNLPNDERVREEKGSKKVMLRNVGVAKFEKILTPIAGRVLAEELQTYLHPEAFFNHTVLHEIAHGLGPGTITVDGKETTVNLSLKELYSHLEEAKADTLGVYNALYLIDEGVLKLSQLADGVAVNGTRLEPEFTRKAVLTTFLAGIFRSTRFGVEAAHGKANLLMFNYLREKGVFSYGEDGRVSFDYEKAPEAVKDLATELLMIQALGDYEAGKAFIAKYGEVSPEMARSFESLVDLPVDIRPISDLP